MRSLDEIVLDTGTVRAAKFRCPARDQRFRDSGPAQNFAVVFPRTSVWIRYSGSRAFVADPTIATIYNAGQEYTRAELSGEGDRCDWFAVTPAIAREIAAAFDPSAAESITTPFGRQSAPVDARLYLSQRIFLSRLERGRVDVLEAEETIIGLVTAVIGRAYAQRARRVAARAEESHRDLADRARALLLRAHGQRLGLRAIAARLGVSEFHLCRVFRAQTGLTLHSFDLEVRLRAGLELLAVRPRDISRISLELGFASHSHFTSLLRRRFGMTPTEVRRSHRD